MFVVFKKYFFHEQLLEREQGMDGGVVTHLLHSFTNTAALHSHAPEIISPNRGHWHKNHIPPGFYPPSGAKSPGSGLNMNLNPMCPLTV